MRLQFSHDCALTAFCAKQLCERRDRLVMLCCGVVSASGPSHRVHTKKTADKLHIVALAILCLTNTGLPLHQLVWIAPELHQISTRVMMLLHCPYKFAWCGLSGVSHVSTLLVLSEDFCSFHRSSAKSDACIVCSTAHSKDDTFCTWCRPLSPQHMPSL